LPDHTSAPCAALVFVAHDLRLGGAPAGRSPQYPPTARASLALLAALVFGRFGPCRPQFIASRGLVTSRRDVARFARHSVCTGSRTRVHAFAPRGPDAPVCFAETSSTSDGLTVMKAPCAGPRRRAVHQGKPKPHPRLSGTPRASRAGGFSAVRALFACVDRHERLLMRARSKVKSRKSNENLVRPSTFDFQPSTRQQRGADNQHKRKTL